VEGREVRQAALRLLPGAGDVEGRLVRVTQIVRAALNDGLIGTGLLDAGPERLQAARPGRCGTSRRTVTGAPISIRLRSSSRLDRSSSTSNATARPLSCPPARSRSTNAR
jgi:hypothetical protein